MNFSQMQPVCVHEGHASHPVRAPPSRICRLQHTMHEVCILPDSDFHHSLHKLSLTLALAAARVLVVGALRGSACLSAAFLPPFLAAAGWKLSSELESPPGPSMPSSSSSPSASSAPSEDSCCLGAAGCFFLPAAAAAGAAFLGSPSLRRTGLAAEAGFSCRHANMVNVTSP